MRRNPAGGVLKYSDSSFCGFFCSVDSYGVYGIGRVAGRHMAIGAVTVETVVGFVGGDVEDWGFG
jgi:hypothetical protein